jgi:hypothetical protein
MFPRAPGHARRRPHEPPLGLSFPKPLLAAPSAPRYGLTIQSDAPVWDREKGPWATATIVLRPLQARILKICSGNEPQSTFSKAFKPMIKSWSDKACCKTLPARDRSSLSLSGTLFGLILGRRSDNRAALNVHIVIICLTSACSQLGAWIVVPRSDDCRLSRNCRSGGRSPGAIQDVESRPSNLRSLL